MLPRDAALCAAPRARSPPRRRVLVAGVARPELASRTAAIEAELRALAA